MEIVFMVVSGLFILGALAQAVDKGQGWRGYAIGLALLSMGNTWVASVIKAGG